MPDTTQLIYEFLSKEGVSLLSKALLTKVNSRIEERIVQTVDENSDAKHVPSALAVYEAINKMSHIKFKTHTGSIEDVTDPNSSYIYLQRDDESDTMWMMYVYDTELGWINIGDTEVDLSNYWSKDPADVEALKLALGLPDEIERLDTKIDDSVTELKQIIKDLPVNLLFDENGSFAIRLTADMNTSIVDACMAVEKPGMYTIYAQRGCPDNPASPVDSSFRGICHIDPLADPENPNPTTGTQLLYGWIMMFDQEAKAYVNYIRRSEASGWQCLNDAANLAAEVQRLEIELSKKVDSTQMKELTEEEIVNAVESAYTETVPGL